MKPENKDMTTAVDPVCGMEVDERTALSGEKDGKTWYFCSPGCREKFLGSESNIQDPRFRLCLCVERSSLHLFTSSPLQDGCLGNTSKNHPTDRSHSDHKSHEDSRLLSSHHAADHQHVGKR